MITVLAVLEKGYESSFEHLAFKQLHGAFQTNLICIPHDYGTLQEGLDAAVGTKVFFVIPGRVEHSVEFSDWVPPEGDLVLCFGSPQENLVKYIGKDIAVHITTAKPVDMMAVCVATVALYVHG